MSDTLVHDGHLATAREVVAGVTAGATTKQLWAALGETGLLDQLYTGEGNRLEVDVVRLAKLLDAVDRRGSVGATLSVCVQVATALPLLAEAAGSSTSVHVAYRRASTGERITALAATDRKAGSDLTALESEVDIQDGELELNGGKRWITNATTAEQFLVLARTRPGRHFTNFAWVLVPSTADGVTTRQADTDLFDGAGIGHLDFDRVRLPEDHLVGKSGRGMAAFVRHITTERLAGALWAVSLCRRTLADTKRWLEQRWVNDSPLWSNEMIRQRFADCLVRVRQLHALCAALGDRVVRDRDSTAAALLKTATGQVVDQVLRECGQLQGAEGFATAGVNQLRAEAAVFAIGGGTTEVVRSMVADHADEVLRELVP